jgi:hypothetical protein
LRRLPGSGRVCRAMVRFGSADETAGARGFDVRLREAEPPVLVDAEYASKFPINRSG